ncbi:MAG: multiheme c-type cytochrome [Kofleriaceae bacterium]
MTRAGAIVALALAACGSSGEREASVVDAAPDAPVVGSSLPSTPGVFAPSLITVGAGTGPGEVVRADGTTLGLELADTDTCATCHPAAAAQWGASAHSFASFGNPIYRQNVERVRRELGRSASHHCGGCHDMPLLVDGLMAGDVPADDLRAHSGVTCALCHGVTTTTTDGNGSYVLRAEPLPTPNLDDAASIAAHRAAASVRPLGSELCVTCHRGFLSPDLGVPVHLAGIDEPTAWRSSAWTGNGAGRIDRVEPRTCIDCHMTREPALPGEVSARDGTIASHRFAGGHSWMAGQRGDADQLARTQAMLVGAATVDVAGVRVTSPGQTPRWSLPADGAAVAGGDRLELDVVVRNVGVGHRFPGGTLDMQDTWLEVEVLDAGGRRLGASGLAHATDADDEEAHVLRAYLSDEDGAIQEAHELDRFRAPIANHTLAPREAAVVRYELTLPEALPASRLPLAVRARLRHRSRTLRMQATICAEARTAAGARFLRGAVGARDAALRPCAAQPITLVASTELVLDGEAPPSARAAWERIYEHGMALTAVVSERLEEAEVVLDAALAAAPAGPPRAMVLAQLGWVASRQGRADLALARVRAARAELPAEARPAVLEAVAVDALSRVWRWREAVAPARALVALADGNAAAWAMLARVLASTGDDRGALAAARGGLRWSPRDGDLLRTQATALRALGSPDADAALAAYDRFRSPDLAATVRIACARSSARCAREREAGHTHALR